MRLTKHKSNVSISPVRSDHFMESCTSPCAAAPPGCCWCCSASVWESGSFWSRGEARRADRILAGWSGFSPSLLRSICGEKTVSQMSLADAVIAQTTIIRAETQLPFHLALLSFSSFQKMDLVAFVTFWLLECSFSRRLTGDMKLSEYSPQRVSGRARWLMHIVALDVQPRLACVVSYCPAERIMMLACYRGDDEWNGAWLNNIAQHETRRC